MEKEHTILKEKLRDYKRKYYLNILVRGSIFFLAILLSTYLLSTTVDFGFQPGTTGRSIIFYSFLVIILSALSWWIIRPLIYLYNGNKQIDDSQAATQIGILFPELSDKLLNTLQLANVGSDENKLISASIEKRISEISVFEFGSRIKISANKKYTRFIAVPAFILLGLFIFVPQYLSESTVRLINYNEEFRPTNYFSLIPLESSEIAFKNEDFTIRYKAEGTIMPENVFVRADNRKIKMISENGVFKFTFNKVQTDFRYSLESSDYFSEPKSVKVYSRPDIKTFSTQILYPKYTGQENQTLTNTGNIKVPEGSSIIWHIKTVASDSAYISFKPNNTLIPLQNTDKQLFTYDYKAFENTEYGLSLQNEFSQNKNEIRYNIEVAKDQHPTISLHSHQDTTLYSFAILGGSISDDYAVSRLELVYSIRNEVHKTERIPIGSNLKAQQYFYQWKFDSIDINEGEQLEYFVRVWDNDGINGSKFSRTPTQYFNIPDEKEIKKNVEKQAEGTKNKLDQTLDQAEDLSEKIEELKNELKSKKSLDWQDKKELEDLIKEKEKLQKELEELNRQNDAFSKKKERFSQPNENLKKKVQQLQKLMDDLLDEETKKLYDELKKLLEEQKGIEKVQEKLDQIQNSEENIEKDIERTLELFKKMQFDYKMDDIINDLDELEQEQKELADETEEKSSETEELKEKQDKLNEEFDEVREEIDKLEELNQELKDPETLEDTTEQEEKVSEEQEKSSDELSQKKRKKASDSQKKASESVQKLKQKMKDMQSNMEMVMLEENIDNLEDIVDNLVKLSFDQESILDNFKGVNQSDPRYVTLSQQQLKLRDDSKIIEDSLMSLASRVFQIASFITRELDAMNDNIESSLQSLKDRKLSRALSNQQLAMTSINNLALLLDDVLQQMQQQMSDATGKGKKGKKGGKEKMPGLSELQKKLNEQIEQLQKSGKSGRQLSEELAKLAAEQEMIRQQLQEMEDKLNNENKGGGNGTKEAIKKMEQTEKDLVNKHITRQTIQRQQDILSRLLKAENAMRERELDKERESENPDDLSRDLPPQFEEYLKAKEKEVELLQTIPLKLNPYYKEEVNKYFKRLGEQ